MTSKKMKILVADDDSLVRGILINIIESDEYIIADSENGAEALDKFRSDPDIGLVISDHEHAQDERP
jgi:CheY-like chemotaxis protein